jgi:hypothetical protein
MSGKSGKTENLEKQVDAAIEAGLIPQAEPPKQSRKRGRPAGKSVERPVQTPTVLTPEEKKIENQKKVNAIVGAVKKRALICKLKAFAAYFPDVAAEACATIVLEELEVDQLQVLYNCFEDNVLGASEITSLPIAIKKILGKTETTLVGIGLSNPDHRVLGEFTKLQGLSQRIEEDREIDTNVKLVAVRMAGKLPRNPYVNIATGIVRVAWDLYNEASFSRPVVNIESDPKYSKLHKSKEK